MQLKPQEIDRMIYKFRENGIFIVKERETGDKHFQIFYAQGQSRPRLIARTKRSLGAKPMEHHIKHIQQQLHLTNKELQDLRDCPLRSNKIAEIYRDRGIL